jgi:D-alanyl-D-alanine carboxypeptidase (penicillin-binding protein 5/6)
MERKLMNRRSLLAQSARSAILMNITKGVTLFEKNANKILFPASLTKLMTILIIFQMLRMESIQLSDRVKISSQAASMKGSNIGLKPSELVMVEDLIKGLILASANDAAVALAEYIAGTEAEFVQ